MVADWIACLEQRPADRTGEDIDIVYARLKDMKIFERLHPTVLQQICYYGYYQDLEEGIVLFRQGDVGTNWYAILSGTVDVNVSQTGKIEDSVTICTLGPGKVFGESVLDDSPRNATVITSAHCELLMVAKKDFKTIWERSKQYLEGIIFLRTQTTATPNGTQEQDPSVPERSEKNEAKTTNKNSSHSLVHACLVFRRVMETTAPKLLRDRKYNMKEYPKCFVGSEAIDWLLKKSRLVHSRFHALSLWQALLEEGTLAHVTHEYDFRDKTLYYKFLVDEGDEEGYIPLEGEELEDEFEDVLIMLSNVGPDAMFRMALRKDPDKRTQEDLDVIYEELLHIKALSNLSTMVKKDLAAVFVLETCKKKGTMLFNQGDEGNSWYIILKGSVNVLVYGKGVVCQLRDGDDFGKLALVNDAPRTASIETCEDNCQFLKVDKDNFNRILRDVEVNTVRMKERGRDVLVLKQVKIRNHFSDRSPVAKTTQQKYSVMAGTPEKMIEHILEMRIDNKEENKTDSFLLEFLMSYPVFMTSEALCMELLTKYHGSVILDERKDSHDESKSQTSDRSIVVKKRVAQIVIQWHKLAKNLLVEDHSCFLLINDLMSALEADKLFDELNALKKDMNKKKEQDTEVADSQIISCRSLSFSVGFRVGNTNIFERTKRTAGKPISRDDYVIFKVFCADHTYTTVRLKYGDTAQKIVETAEERVLLGDDCVLCEVKSNSEIIPYKPDDMCVVTRLSVNGRLFVAPREHLDSLTPLSEQEGPEQGSFNILEMTSSREIAYHLTVYDYELFTSINIYELVYYTFGRERFDKITANLDLFLKRFNEVHYWVITEICLASQISKRVHLLKKFIKIATHCKEYRNWNSFFAIIMGLNNVAVSRLSQTWEKLPSKFKKMFEEFEASLDPSRNHRVYRLAIGKMKPPIIPFMALLMKDITFINEGNKTYFDDLVNFEKLRMITSTLHLIEYCRSKPFVGEAPPSIKNVNEIVTYVRTLRVNDNQRNLTQLSHRLEPRKS
ncbi:rap guanine nucleotide exchange factor 4-like [Actinia tenebrosa]|uniref:Rap guanine nucleotide exchange factor 4-like n=1 Tax=Actinia tenebrosa TaxID=6105 RepID=A0A6P8HZA1_ACTTE|nr:rap guanine nucleotide exchange factor 4-like [Actinia tenebrosa]